MDFRQTIQPNPRPAASNPQPAHGASDDSTHAAPAHNFPAGGNKWFKILTVVVLVGIAILLAAIALGIGRGKTDNSESKFVDKSKYQAVFLNNGQVYFGNVQSLNSQYIRMTNIYYLTQADSSTSSSSSSNYSLVKLGCQQIHDPYDAMVINRDQVSFWENLQDNGKVVSSIKDFKQQNPNGPNCSQVSNQTQATNNSTQGGATNTNTNNTKQ
jgi:hypothetical protein